MPGLSAARRRAALEAILDGERRFLPVLRAAMNATFRKASAALEPDVVIRSAGEAPPDPRDLIRMRSEWERWVDRDLLPIVAELYTEAGNDAFRILGGDGSYFTVDSPMAQQWLAESRNRLVRIGDDLWSRSQEQLVEAMSNGESINDMAARLRKELTVGNVRAERIARTEVVGAKNSGALAGARGLGADAPQYKQWISTLSARTRPEHRVADGQVVALGEAFTVGGEALDVPGDPNGSAGNVIQCRCTWASVDAPDATLEQEGRQSLSAEELELVLTQER